LETKNYLISKTRLISQKIASSEFKTPSEIVSWMGAMQAQDYTKVTQRGKNTYKAMLAHFMAKINLL
jgi:hypothetical protein